MSSQPPKAEMPRSWDIRFGLLTDPGRVRDRNEDACAVFVPYAGESPPARTDALFLVADGMGGHEAGDLASAYVASKVRNWFTSGFPPPEEDAHTFARELRAALEETNAGLLDLARERKLARGAGSTATVACLRDDLLHLAHVGDTRLYRYRSGCLERLTPDHSWVEEQQRAGLLTAEEAATHPQRHVLTECLGVGPNVNVFVHSEPVVPGDRYLLCSDGLHGTVPDQEIGQILSYGDDPQEAARELVALANERQGPDNITAVVVHLHAPFTGAATYPELEAPREKKRSRTIPGILVGAGGILILGAAALLGMLRSGESQGEPAGQATQASSSPMENVSEETAASPPTADSLLPMLDADSPRTDSAPPGVDSAPTGTDSGPPGPAPTPSRTHSNSIPEADAGATPAVPKPRGTLP